MWLLSTHRAELRYFPSPHDVKDGYAILSHVWDMTEQSFHDVQEIRQRCALDGTNPRDFVSEKIRRCCELAESHGFDWVWIDTCCIDKTSSAELSEAINSMIRYYSLARICYGYLRDVPFFTDIRDVIASYTFRCSIWFGRGWTLQELIAPRVFHFICRSWQVLGSKTDFACFLERCTNIPETVLRSEVSHTTCSIAQRMSWFGERRTTRVEDEAYSLLGLFDVNMPIIYGEGRRAFWRLQEEILKRFPDTALFAWSGGDSSRNDQQESSLFAPSPSAFAIWNINSRAPQHIAGEADRLLSPVTVATDSPVNIFFHPSSIILQPSPLCQQMGSARLPIEVCELIIDSCVVESVWFSGYDTLRACALTCTRWAVHARWNLYRHIWLPSSYTADLLDRTLSSAPHLGRFVRRLTVGGNVRRTDSQYVPFARGIFLRSFENLHTLNFLADVQHFPPGYQYRLRRLPITELNLPSHLVEGKYVRDAFRLIWSLPELRTCRVWAPECPTSSDVDAIEALVANRPILGVCVHLTFLSLHFFKLSASNRFPPKGAFGRSVRYLELYLEPIGLETEADLEHILDCISRQHDLRTLHLTRLGTNADLTPLKILLMSFLSAISPQSGFKCLSVDLDLGYSPFIGAFDHLLTDDLEAALKSFPKPPRFDLRVIGDESLRELPEMLSARLREWMPQSEHSVGVVVRKCLSTQEITRSLIDQALEPVDEAEDDTRRGHGTGQRPAAAFDVQRFG